MDKKFVLPESDGRIPLPPNTVLYYKKKNEDEYYTGEFLTIGPLIGAGSSGLVYQASKTTETGKQRLSFAVKELYPRPLINDNSIYRSESGVVKAITPKGKELFQRMQEQFLQEVENGQEIASMVEASHFPMEYLTTSKGIFILMKEITQQSKSLWEVVETYTQANKLPPFRTTVRIMEELLLVLSPVHNKHYIHGDLNPSNLWLEFTNNGETIHTCWLADFACVRQTDSDGYCALVKGPVSGTPGFLAPEYYCHCRPFGQRSEVYSVGKIFWLLLTGKYSTNIPSRRNRYQLEEEDLKVIGCPPWQRQEVNKILAKSLAFRPDGRYSNAADMYEAIKTLKDASSRRFNPSFPGIDKKTYQKPAQLGELLKTIGNNNPTIISGFGGLGKTTLAIALGQEIEKTSFGHSYFVRFPDSGSIKELITEKLAKACRRNVISDSDGNRLPDKTICENVFRELNQLTENDCLIIDNMDSEQLKWSQVCYGADESDSWIKEIYDDLIGLSAHIIITTRTTPPDGIGHIVKIDQLSMPQLRAILKTHYTSPCNDQELDALITLVDGHTLTVDLIGRTMAHTPGMTPQKMYDLLYNEEYDSEDFANVSSGHHPKLGEQRIEAHLQKLFQATLLPEKEQVLLCAAVLLLGSGNYHDDYSRMLIEHFSQVCPGYSINDFNHLVERGWLQKYYECNPPRRFDDISCMWYSPPPNETEFLCMHPLIRQILSKTLPLQNRHWEDVLSRLKRLIVKTFRQDSYMLGILCIHQIIGERNAFLKLNDLTGKEDWCSHLFEVGLEDLHIYLHGISVLEKSIADDIDVRLPKLCSFVGCIFESYNDNDNALAYKEKAVDYWCRLSPKFKLDFAISNISLAITYLDLLDYHSVLRCANIAKDILDATPPTSNDVGVAYTLICIAYSHLGKPKNYATYQTKAESYIPYLLESNFDAGYPFTVQGFLPSSSAGGSLKVRLHMAHKVRRILEAVLLTDKSILFSLYAKIAIYSRQTENYKDAEIFTLKAISNNHNEDSFLYAHTCYRESQYRFEKRMYDSALNFCIEGQRVLRLLPRKNVEFECALLAQMGKAYHALGQESLASKYDTASLTLLEQVLLTQIRTRLDHVVYLCPNGQERHAPPYLNPKKSYYNQSEYNEESFYRNMVFTHLFDYSKTTTSISSLCIPALGWMYLTGHGCKKNMDEGLSLLHVVADDTTKPSEMANLYLALYYSSLETMNQSLAMKYFQRAEELGGDDMASVIAEAQYFLGHFSDS